jgi:hypothetical protein
MLEQAGEAFLLSYIEPLIKMQNSRAALAKIAHLIFVYATPVVDVSHPKNSLAMLTVP